MEKIVQGSGIQGGLLLVYSLNFPVTDLLSFQNIKFKIRKNCAVCRQTLNDPVIRLPDFPLTEIYVSKKPDNFLGYADQYFHLCPNCGHGQISRLLEPKVLYSQSAYFFRTSESRSASYANDVFLTFIKEMAGRRKLDKIVEIGCSDLYLLKHLENKATELIGIDPILKGKEKELTRGKIKVYGDFFENLNLDYSLPKGRTLVICSHTLEHMEDPREHLSLLMEKAGRETLFVYQFPGLETLVADFRFDQIFHQHLQYFSLDSFKRLLFETGGELIKSKVNYLHWGSLMVAFRKKRKKINPSRFGKIDLITHIRKDYAVFQERMEHTNAYLNSLEREKTVGFGAALMLPVLGYHLKNDFSAFAGILDDDPRKNGRYYLNLPVKIILPASNTDLRGVNVVITALNTTRGIIDRVLSFSPKRIILPIPVL